MSEIVKQTQSEVAAMCEGDYAKIRASLESLAFVKNLIGDFLYTDVGYMGDETAAAMMESIVMRMGFIREAITLVEPALSNLEQYLATLGSSGEGSDGGAE